MPLPERIPKPNGVIAEQMEKCGIKFDKDDKSLYVTYILPQGWRTVDDSWREDLPNFFIVDDQGMVRFGVTGAWKGTYDNELHLTYVKNPYKFEAKNKQKLIPSETNA